MKSINLSGSSRGNVGKSDANQLRAEEKSLVYCTAVMSKPIFGHMLTT